jgi:hypothetical protein
MSFKSVWGFDPDEIADRSNVFGRPPESQNRGYSMSEEQAAGIPSDVCAQIHELQRIFRP